MKKFLFLMLALLCIASAAMAAETTYTGVCDHITVNTPGEHTVILNDVNIEATDSSAIRLAEPADKLTIILKDGSENTLRGASSWAGIAVIGNTELVIRCESAGKNHECDENCGTLNVYGGDDAAGIGGNDNHDLSGILTINGGNIYAKSGWYGAGIGGGENADLTGRVVINGGNVRASAGHWGSESYDNGYGIGGGAGGDLTGHVVITGGKVTADSSTDVSAGIGGFHMDGNILISGGEVIAIGGDNCAAIGGIKHTSGNITISGGKVYAVVPEGNRIVGIGSASSGNMSGTLMITGGEVFVFAPAGIAIGAADVDKMTGKIIIDPAVGMIESEIGDCDYVYADEVVHYQASNVAPLEGSPYAARQDITHLLKNKSFAHFRVVIPLVPQTGDQMNFVLLSVLALMGVMGMALVLRSKRKA